MKFFKLLLIILICLIVVPALGYISASKNGNPYLTFEIIILGLVAWIIFATVKYYRNRKKFPGGTKGAVLQGIWVLEQNFRFVPTFKKWETVPVEDKKNYFEFKGSNFRSGDFDERHRQLPADYSPFSVEGGNIILESEAFKKANWKWIIKQGKLELTVEMLEPKNSKSRFIFYKKNWR
jgi:hypothetical protein